VLELACGTGRLAVPLAEAGHQVTGVDIDPAMLGRARARWGTRRRGRGSLELIEADLRTLELGARFDLAFLGLNTLIQLGAPDAQADAFACLARHLTPGGVAAVDVWLPAPEDLVLYDGRLVLEWVRDDPETGLRVAKQTSARYDPATAVAEIQTLFDAWPPAGGAAQRLGRTDRIRFIGAWEVERRATEAGLVVETRAADYDLTPFGPGAERLVLVAGLV
jgi:SAM-dependent methyltransferase